MKKALTYLSIFLILIISLYSLGRLVILYGITSNLNKRHANNYIDASTLGLGGKYFVRFKSASTTGFPFKWAIEINGWQEEGESNVFECREPITLGYDLLAKRFFILYSGKAYGRYKPLNSGYGSAIEIENYLVSMKLPRTFLSKVIYGLISKKQNRFELINDIHHFAITSGKIKISDLVDGKLLYEMANQDIEISFEKAKYYKDMEDFFNNIPQRWDVISSNNVTYSKFEGKTVFPTSIFYNFWRSFLLSGNSKFYLKTGANKFEDIATDLEIGVDYSKSSSTIHEASSVLFYKGKLQKDKSEIQLKTNSDISIKPGFFDAILDFTSFFTKALAANEIGMIINNELDYIKANKEKFPFKELENRNYNLNVDLTLRTSGQQSASLQVKDLHIASGKSGVSLKNNTELKNIVQWKTDGGAIISNYAKVVELAANSIYNLGTNKFTPGHIISIRTEVFKNFLLNISDNPNSTSEDSSIEYNFEFDHKITKSKIGGIDLDKLQSMYILALYQTAAGRIKSEDNILETIKMMEPKLLKNDRIMELFEDLKKKAKSNNNNSPRTVDPKIWEQLIKN
jgi:hypothetical protein